MVDRGVSFHRSERVGGCPHNSVIRFFMMGSSQSQKLDFSHGQIR